MSAKAIAENCLAVKYLLSPAPQTLVQTHGIFRHFNQYGKIIQFRPARDAATMKLQGSIRMLFYDPPNESLEQWMKAHKFEAQYYANEREFTKHLISRSDNPTELESKLLRTTEIELTAGEIFKTDITLLTRDPVIVTYPTDRAILDGFKISKQLPHDQRMLELQRIREQTLLGFDGLFGDVKAE